MPRATGTHVLIASPTIAQYRDSLRPISDAVKTVLTKTADTGQVDWAAITAPPGANIVRDFEVFGFSDALHTATTGAKPIFIRLDYGLQANGVTTIYATVGTGTDGAGNITGVTTPTGTNRQILSNFTAGGTGLSFWTSSDGSYFTLLFGALPTGTTLSGHAGGIVVDRTRNADGTGNGEGFTAHILQGGEWQFAFHRYTNGQTNPTGHDFNIFSVNPMAGGTTAFIGDTSYAFPMHGLAPAPQAASQGILYGFPGDWPRFSEVTIPHHGNAAATWISMGNGGVLRYPYKQNPTTSALNIMSPIIRY